MVDSTIRAKQKIEAIHIRLEGYIDHDTCIDFEDSLSSFLEKGKKFILLDCRNVKYISDAGIGALIATSRKFENNNGCLVFYDMPDELSRIIEFLNLGESLVLAANKEEALGYLKRCAALNQDGASTLQDEPPVELDEKPDMNPNPQQVKPGGDEVPFEELFDENVNLSEEMEQLGVILDEKQEDSAVENQGDNDKGENIDEIVDHLFDDVNQAGDILEERADENRERTIERSIRLVECIHCRQVSKVREPGKYSCPKCLKEFVLNAQGRVIFE